MIQIKLFSHLELCLPAAPTERLQVRKTGLLLAYLACFSERAHLRSHLATLFWPDAEEAAAMRNLRASLHELRKRLAQGGLPPEALKTTAQEVTLNPDYIGSDVGMFRAAIQRATAGSPEEQKASLERAVGLYRGHLLVEFSIDWVEQERGVLATMCQQALTKLVAWFRAEKTLDQALDFAQQAIRLDPYDSDMHIQLMSLFLETREYEQTVNQYAKMERQLKKIGISPPPEASELRRRAFAARHKEMLGTKTVARTSALKPSNLLPALTQFFGRRRELEQLDSMLAKADLRLITLTGPGGSGKTRLALETALATRSLFNGRTYWVDMLEIDDPDRILAHTARTLLPDSSAAPNSLARLQRSLASDQTLLILDNFEHLVEGGNLRIVELLTSIPALKILVTSRQPLQVQGEQVLPLAPLPTPGMQQMVEELRMLDSVRLFEDRAQSVRSTFALNADNAPAVARICNALEGIPLALEIAATWCNTLTPDVIAQAMGRRFELLVNPLQDAVSRHASLWKVIDWSYQQLSPELRNFFTALSVFRGGWNLEAMEAVCTLEATAANLRLLQVHSLLTIREVDGEFRFFFLETLREFAHLQLPAAQYRLLLQRHAEYFLRFASSAYSHLFSSEAPLWLKRLSQEHDNLLLALDTYKNATRFDEYLRLAAALRPYWVIQGHSLLGNKLLKEGLAHYTIPDVIRADALRAAHACSDGLDLVQSQAWLDESLRITLPLKDNLRSAEALVYLSRLQHPAVLPLIEQACELYREIGHTWGEADCLHMKGGLLFAACEYEQAELILLQCVHLRERAGDIRGPIFTCQYLGNIYLYREEYSKARDAYHESLARALRLKDGFAEGLTRIALGQVDYYCGEYTSARLLTEQGLKLLEEAAYVPIYEVNALLHLARVALKQKEKENARNAIQEASRRLLAHLTQSVHYMTTCISVLRIAMLVANEYADYKKACKFLAVLAATVEHHSVQLTKYELDELKSGEACLKANLPAETITALRQEFHSLSLTTALELVLTT